MKTLLEKALDIPAHKLWTKHNSPELRELAISWCVDKVTTAQVAGALNCSKQNVYSRLASAMRGIIRDYELAKRNGGNGDHS